MAGTWALRAVLIIAVVAALYLKLVNHVEIDTTVIALVAIGAIALFGRFDIEEVEIAGIKFGFRKKEVVPATTVPAQKAVSPAVSVPIAHAESMVDTYGIRLAKLMPVETVLIYLISLRISQSDVQLSSFGPVIMWSLFGICLIVTPVTLLRYRVSLGQAILSTLIFVGWAFAMGGPFEMFSWYTPAYGAAFLALVTFGAPLAFARQK